MLAKLKDEETRRLLKSLVPDLVNDGIILEKTVRSGDTLFRDEMDRIVTEGLFCALSPGHVMFGNKSNNSEVKRFLETRFHDAALFLRLRHLPLPILWNGITVPVFGCVFFDAKSRKCTIYTKEFRPMQCRLFPLYEAHPSFDVAVSHVSVTKKPMCNDDYSNLERVTGELTPEQYAMAETYMHRLHRFSSPSASTLEATINDLAVVPASDSLLRSLGFVNAEVFWAVQDMNPNLEKLMSRALSCEKKTIASESFVAVQNLKNKIAENLQWWNNFMMKKEDRTQIYEAMVEMFYDRYLMNLSLRRLPFAMQESLRRQMR